MRTFLEVLERVNRAVYYLIGAILAVISVVVMIQVLVRLVLTHLGYNLAAPWTEELARFLLVWLIFLGAAVGCRRMQLISLDFVLHLAPDVIGRALRYVALGVCLALFFIMMRYGVEFARVIGLTELSPVMQISKAWVYWAMPVGAALMFVNTVAFILDAWVEDRDIRAGGTLATEE